MASQGKGKRRMKGRTLNLQNFRDEDSEAPQGFTVVSTLNWADEGDEDEEQEKNTYEPKRDLSMGSKVILPTVPKSARTPDFDVTKVPDRPPFKAYLGNLPYEVTEDEITRFFKKLKITSVQLVRDGGDRGRQRGVGFAEFEDRESLIEALHQNGDTLKNRSIRVSLSGDTENNDRSRWRDDREDRTAGDWRSGAREAAPARNGDEYQPYESKPYGGRSSYERSDRRGSDRSGGFDRTYQRSDRDFRDSRDYNRGAGGGFREGGFGYNREERSGGGGGGGYGFDDRRDRYRDNRYSENRDREGDRPARSYGSGYEPRSREPGSQRYSPSPPVSTDSRNDDDKDAPKERPKLNLKPRTKPIEPADGVSANSAIFGGAKPVDTAAREREIEEKLAKEHREKEAQLSDTASSKGSISGRRPVRLSRGSRDEGRVEGARSRGQSQGSVDDDEPRSEKDEKSQDEPKKSE